MRGFRKLTELEGAVLTEIGLRGNNTAYKVRRAFEESPSVHWRGSAGAVSPAIYRLTTAELIATQPHPTRAGKTLTLTAKGSAALYDWATDPELACGFGLDPFRLRSGVWTKLDRDRRREVLTALLTQLEEDRAALATRERSDPVDIAQTELARALVAARIGWVRATLHNEG